MLSFVSAKNPISTQVQPEGNTETLFVKKKLGHRDDTRSVIPE